MATQVVELTGDEVALLRSYDRAVKKQAEYEAKLRAGGDAGAAAGVQIEDALAKVRIANDEALRGLLKDLKLVSPVGQAAAEGLRGHFVEAGKAGFKSMATIIEEIRAIDPAAAEAAMSAAASMNTAAIESKTAFQQTLSALSDLGPEGAEAARKIREDMRTAAAQSAGSFDELLTKLSNLDPTAASSADAIRASMAAAASDTSGRLNAVLEEMRSLGPAGRKAADEIKTKFVEAGKISERSVIDIAKAFESIDPEAAAAADAIIKQMQRGASEGEFSFKSMGRSMLSELAAIAGGYVGIQEAIQLVNGHIEQQRQLLGETRNAHIALAAAQQDTFKNLIASDVLSQSALIREAVPQLAKETGFSDLSKITLAIGAGKSAGGTDQQILSAIRAAAPLNRLSPEGLDANVQGALLLAQTTGIDDARQNLNLLLATADPALVKDPNKLAQLLPAAVANTVATTKGQDPVTASREAAALFAALNKGGNDFAGESTVTNQATFILHAGVCESDAMARPADGSGKPNGRSQSCLC